MKKLLCLCLSIVLVFSLVACGNKTETEPPKENNESLPTVTEPTNTEPIIEKPEQLGVWNLNPDIKPEHQPLTYEEVEIDGDKIKVTKTVLSYNKDDVLDKLNKNEYIMNNYSKLYSYNHERHEGQHVDENKTYSVIYDYEHILGGAGYIAPMHIEIMNVRHYYEGAYQIEISLSNLEKAALNQSAIFEAVNAVVPHFAEYLVYGKDLDGLDVYNGNELYGEFDMEEVVGDDKGSYRLSRTIMDFGDIVTVSFQIAVKSNEQENFKAHLFPDESNIYQKSEYTTEAVLAKNYPELSPFNYAEFSDAFFKDVLPNYHHVSPKTWIYYDYVDGDDLRHLYLSIEFEVYDNSNVSIASFQSLIMTSLNNQKISSQRIDFRVWMREPLADDVKGHADAIAKKFELLLDGLTINPIEVTKDNNNHASAFSVYEIDGRTYDGALNATYAFTPSVDISMGYYGG